MNPTVYIETTIPSYYCDTREALKGEIERTRTWWDVERSAYECFVSLIVLEELMDGNYPEKERCMNLVADLPLLAVTEEILEIAEAYQARQLMPRIPAADAIHLALASYYRMDYLLTWNCRHLANANKVRRLEILNSGMGLSVPVLATPYMLIGGEAE